MIGCTQSQNSRLAQVIDNWWFRERAGGSVFKTLELDLDRVLGEMDDESLECLLELAGLWSCQTASTERTILGAIKAFRSTGVAQLGNKVLARHNILHVLEMAVISEHCLDKLLLLPREMRERDLAEIAKGANLDPQELRSFYFRWHSEYRKRFYEIDDES